VSSRKRKLRELFAVATDENVFPTIDPNDATAPSTITAEKKFLIDCDISMYVISTSHFAYIALFRVCVALDRSEWLTLFAAAGKLVNLTFRHIGSIRSTYSSGYLLPWSLHHSRPSRSPRSDKLRADFRHL